MEPNLSKLREFLLNELSEQELSALCKDIGLDYQALAGTGTFGKTRELLITAQANDQLHRLLRRLQELKPVAFQNAGLSALRFETREERAPKHSANRTTGYVVPLVLLFVSAIGMALFLLGPREGTRQSDPQSAGVEAVTTPTIPTRSLVSSPEPPTATPDFADAPDAVHQAQPATPTVLPTPPTATISPSTPTASPAKTRENHPAAQTVRQLNELLPRLYTGQVNSTELGSYMTNGALNAVMEFNNTRLLRAMRLLPNQRASLEVTYEYINPPALVEESANSATVSSREFWRYFNKLNSRVACEVRDYTYTLIKESERYRVARFQSQMLDNRCRN